MAASCVEVEGQPYPLGDRLDDDDLARLVPSQARRQGSQQLALALLVGEGVRHSLGRLSTFELRGPGKNPEDELAQRARRVVERIGRTDEANASRLQLFERGVEVGHGAGQPADRVAGNHGDVATLGSLEHPREGGPLRVLAGVVQVLEHLNREPL
ncbi:MAG TPA: hypothetical protein VGR77_11820 [Candidatus Dormibacteraeota bacterium]|nr:hypothetical protein [Candidatus Dormibacteraeota bacterium]